MCLKFAWIGLGSMGRELAKNLCIKGSLETPLILFNRTPARAESLASELGAERVRIAESVQEAVAQADIIFLCLADDAAVKETIEEALATANVEKKIFVDSSTVHPDVTSELASATSSKGAHFASMTVLGSPAIAAAGGAICIASGPTAALDAIRSYTTNVMCRQVIEFRDEAASKVDLLKIIANTFILNVNQVIAEGLVLAEKASVEPLKLQELLIALFGGVYATYAQRMTSGDYAKSAAQVPVEIALKDAHHALRVAASAHAALPSLETAVRHLEAVKTEHVAGSDSSAVYGVTRVKNGLPFDRPARPGDQCELGQEAERQSSSMPDELGK